MTQPVIRQALTACSCIVAFLPIPVLIDAYFVPPILRPLWIVMLFALAGLGAWMANLIRVSNAVLKSVLVSMLLLVPSCWFSVIGSQSSMIVRLVFLGLATILLAIVTVNALRLDYSGRMPAVWVAGLIVQFASFFLFTRTPLLRPWLWLIWLSSFVTIALVYFVVNAISVNMTLSSRQTRLPHQVRVFNRVVVGGMLALVLVAFVALLFFVNLSAIQSAIVHLLALLLSLGHASQQSGQAHLPSFHFPKQPQMQRHASGNGMILRIIAIVFLALFVLLCIVAAWRAVKRLWAWLQQQRLTEESLGYIDEVESLVHESKRISRRNLFRRRKRDVDWKDIESSEEKVRFLYRQCIRIANARGCQFNAAETAREHLQDIRRQVDDAGNRSTDYLRVVRQLEQLYDPARYDVGHLASANIDVRQLEDLWQLLRKVI